MRSLWAACCRFCRDERGAVLSTEAMLWLTLLVFSLTVGVAAVRFAASYYLLDEARSIAAMDNAFSFDTLSSFYGTTETPGFSLLFPGLGETEISPQLAPAGAGEQ